MRIHLVSQMYPGPKDPDRGVFVKQLVDQLSGRGHEIVRTVIDRRGGSRAKFAGLALRSVRDAVRFKPDVVYGHYLFPTGAIAAMAARASGAGLVVTAHGGDVRNIGTIRGVATGTRMAVRRASVVAVSDYLRQRLIANFPELAGRVDVVNCGVDVDRFTGGSRPAEVREALGWRGDPPYYLFVGSLTELKNLRRLVEAFDRLERGSLALVGDGPLRGELENHPRLHLVGRIPFAKVPEWMAACDILCQPTLVEAFGQAILEGMASERTVVATRVGGPPEFVTPEAGVLVEPTSVDSIEDGLRRAAEFARPNTDARVAAQAHDVRQQARRIEAVLEVARDSRR